MATCGYQAKYASLITNNADNTTRRVEVAPAACQQLITVRR